MALVKDYFKKQTHEDIQIYPLHDTPSPHLLHQRQDVAYPSMTGGKPLFKELGDSGSLRGWGE